MLILSALKTRCGIFLAVIVMLIPFKQDVKAQDLGALPIGNAEVIGGGIRLGNSDLLRFYNNSLSSDNILRFENSPGATFNFDGPVVRYEVDLVDVPIGISRALEILEEVRAEPNYGYGNGAASQAIEIFNSTGHLDAVEWVGIQDFSVKYADYQSALDQLGQLDYYQFSPNGMPGRYEAWPTTVGLKDQTACICGGDPAAPIPIPVVIPMAGGGGLGLACTPSLKPYYDCAEDEAYIDVGYQKLSGPEVASIADDFSFVKQNFANVTLPNSFATTVALLNQKRETICTGVLVGNRTILTAAHCFCGENTPITAFFGDRGWATTPIGLEGGIRTQYPLAAEAENMNSLFCDELDTHKASKDSDQATPFPEHDIAAISIINRLDEALALAVLPTEPILMDGSIEPTTSNAVIAGFGVRDAADVTGKKHYAEVKLLLDACSDGGSHAQQCLQGTEFVATGLKKDSNADSCFGDSGGPLFLDAPHPKNVNETIRYLAGIVSRGTFENESDRCGEGGIYTDLRNLDTQVWVSSIISGN